MMYAVNSLKYGWMDDVKLVFFGPAEKALLADTGLSDLGLDVQYVGSLISGYIKDGYTPLVW